MIRSDTIKLVFSYIVAMAIIAGTFYALVLSPHAVEADVKLWLTGAATGAMTFVFGDQVATRTARQQQQATSAATTSNGNGTKVDGTH